MAALKIFRGKRGALLAGTALAGMAGGVMAPAGALAAGSCTGANSVTCSGNLTGTIWDPYVQNSGGANQALTFNGVTLNSAASTAVEISDQGYGVNLSYIETPRAVSHISGGARGLYLTKTGDGGNISVMTNAGSSITIAPVSVVAYGVLLEQYNIGAGGIVAALSGDISAASAPAYNVDTAYGVKADSWATGPISISTSGHITVSGALAYGIYASDDVTPAFAGAGAGAITVRNTGAMDVSAGYGVFALGFNGADVSVANNKTITVGYGSDGSARGDGRGVYGESWGGKITVTNDVAAVINVTGRGVEAWSYAYSYQNDAGVYVDAHGGAIDITNVGVINAGFSKSNGEGAGYGDGYGVYAYSSGYGYNYTGSGGVKGSVINVLNDSAGVIKSTHDGVYAISDVNDYDTDSNGNYVGAALGGDVNVTNKGSILAGHDGVEAYSNFIGGAIHITNAGSIVATNEAIYAEQNGAADNNIVNSGIMHSTDGAAVDLRSFGVGVDGLTGSLIVTNSSAGDIRSDKATGVYAVIDPFTLNALSPLHSGPVAVAPTHSRDTYKSLGLIHPLGESINVALDIYIGNAGLIVGGGTLDAGGVYRKSGSGSGSYYQNGIYAETNGTGDIVVANSGAVYGDAGISVSNVGGGNAIVLNSNSIAAVGGAGVEAHTSGAAGGAVYVENSGNISATGGHGVEALNSGSAPSNYLSDTVFGAGVVTDVEVLNSGRIVSTAAPCPSDRAPLSSRTPARSRPRTPVAASSPYPMNRALSASITPAGSAASQATASSRVPAIPTPAVATAVTSMSSMRARSTPAALASTRGPLADSERWAAMCASTIWVRSGRKPAFTPRPRRPATAASPSATLARSLRKASAFTP